MFYSEVKRNGLPNKTDVCIYTREGTVIGHHFEKRCTSKVIDLCALMNLPSSNTILIWCNTFSVFGDLSVTLQDCRAGAFYGYSVKDGKRYYDDDALKKPYFFIKGKTAFQTKYLYTIVLTVFHSTVNTGSIWVRYLSNIYIIL